MKTSKEIINELHEAIKTVEPKQHRICFVIALTNLEEREKQIQLDAFKAGMTEAAEINIDTKLIDGLVEGSSEAYHWSNGLLSGRIRLVKAILTARDDKTSL